MITLQNDQHVPSYSLDADPVLSGKLFSMKTLEGVLPHESELLLPHRKNYYLLVFARRGNSRHWVDMTPYQTKDNAFYVFSPNQIIVKEEPKRMWGTALAFDNEFLALHDNASLARLPLIRNE